jgi:hypothetical protein
MVQTYQDYFLEGRLVFANLLNRQFGARGIFNNCANVNMIKGEKGAWERVVVEKYTENNKDSSLMEFENEIGW